MKRLGSLSDSVQIYPKRHLSQHFLTNRSICEKMVDAIPSDIIEVTEIGPGLGILTECLLEKGLKVVTVEIDKDLHDHIRSRLGKKYGNMLESIEGDIVQLIQAKNPISLPSFAISNLPYNISSSFFGKLLDSKSLTKSSEPIFKNGIIMVQKEFGERLISKEGSKKYGALSIMFQLKTNSKKLLTVGKEQFRPIPKVDSMVISFSFKEECIPKPRDEDLLRAVVRTSFSSRRKKLKNSLLNLPSNFDLETEQVLEILEAMNITNVRPEKLSPEQFILLSNKLYSKFG